MIERELKIGFKVRALLEYWGVETSSASAYNASIWAPARAAAAFGRLWGSTVLKTQASLRPALLRTHQDLAQLPAALIAPFVVSTTTSAL